MKNKRVLLLKTLFASASRFHILKCEPDKKKRSIIKGELAGTAVLYVILAAYCALTSVGMGYMNTADLIPGITAGIISIMSFFLTFFKTNGYLFAFKEYDMLMAMPFSVKTIVEARFIYMYAQNLLWSMPVSIAMYVGFAIYGFGGIAGGIFWFILSLFIPIIPMIAASLLGTLIAGAGSGVKNKKLVQIILTFIVVIPLFFSRFIIEKIFRDNRLETLLSGVGNALERTGKFYAPVKWFSEAVSNHRVSSAMLFIGISILLFEAVFLVVSRFYRQINSGLMSSSAKRRFKVKSLKRRSMVMSVAYKEFKRLIGSTVYATNVLMGEILALVLGVAALFVEGGTILSNMTQGAMTDPETVYPAIPLLASMIVGLMSSTVCSPSLEGRNFWIIQCMPISKREFYKGKMLFNMILETPFGLFCTVALCISFKMGIVDSLICAAVSVFMCLISTYYGLFCGIKHINLEWSNEIEVVKQGPAAGIYVFSVIIGSSLAIVGAVALRRVLDTTYVLVIVLAVAAGLTALSRYAAYSKINKQ